MEGGTLVASKRIKLHSHYKKRFEDLGFNGVTITDVGNDGLHFLIAELQPKILLIGGSYYKCCTPFRMRALHKRFPKLNIAAISLDEYPLDLAMYFVVNGARSYANYIEGREEFYKGLKEIKNGKEYVSPEVMERIKMRELYPKPTGGLTDRQIEVLRLVCNGFTGEEIAATLQLSIRRVNNIKTEMYTALNVRNENEAIRAALCQGIITVDELNFYPDNYDLKPLPEKKEKRKKKNGGKYDYQD